MRKVLCLLSELNDDDVEWMVNNGHRQAFSAGSDLIAQGQPIDTLLIILEGEADVMLGSQELVIARLEPGEILGEISFVDEQLPSATVRALSAGYVLAIPRSMLIDQLKNDLGFASRFYRGVAISLAQRVRRTSLLGYGEPGMAQQAGIDLDELDANLLDNVHLAGRRFRTILERLLEAQ